MTAPQPRVLGTLALSAVLSTLVGTAALAAGPNGDPENADRAESADEGEEIFDSRVCPEIFGDEAIVETNRAQRTERLQAVWRGPSELNLMHQVPWWTAPRAVRMPHALIVEVVAAQEDEDESASTAAADPATEPTDATGEGVATESKSEVAAEEPKPPPPTSASGSAATDSFIITHSKNAPPPPPPADDIVREAYVELDASFEAICEPGLYRVGVDDALGQEARIFAILEEGVLIESEQNLGLVVVEDGPPPPSWRMIWRSSYAIEFEQPASKAKKKKAKKKKKKKKRSRRSRRKKKK